MNRFQLLINKNKSVKPIAYKFKATNNTKQVYAYLKKCIQDGVSFDTNNIYLSILDIALCTFSKEENILIITGTEKCKRMLTMSNNLALIEIIDRIPERIKQGICYWDLDPKKIPSTINIILAIQRKHEYRE